MESRIYDPVKAVADCIEYGNKIGVGVAVKPPRYYFRSACGPVDELWRAAARGTSRALT